ncbi:MAG: extracellular solute-binding protein [Deltaproteobacteria bacterium]|nr:extracellular solute-binding protein [Deltaproteobacteria bacterium]
MSRAILRRVRLVCLLQIWMLVGLGTETGLCATTADVVARLRDIPPAERQAMLEAGARREGAFVFYGTMSVDHVKRVLAGFHQRYPFLSIRDYRAGSTTLLSKILAEARAGKHDVDIIDQVPGAAYELIKAGLVEKYLSPNRNAVRDEMLDGEGLWAGSYHIVVVTAYNTRQVRKEEVPRNYEDLLHPRWKGRIVLDTQDADWFNTLLEYWGEEKGVAYMKRLAALNPDMRTGHTLEAQLIAAGEYSLSPLLYGYRIAEMAAQGAPIDFVLFDPVISKPRPLLLAKRAPHPHAGILFADWMISEEAQTIMARDLGRGSVRKGMKSKYERLDHPKYLVVRDDTLGPVYKKRLVQYQEIFRFR